jgi:hypothetical protein
MATAVWEGKWEELVCCGRRHDEEKEGEQSKGKGKGKEVQIYEDEERQEVGNTTSSGSQNRPRRTTSRSRDSMVDRSARSRSRVATRSAGASGRDEQAELDAQLLGSASASANRNKTNTNDDDDDDPDPSPTTVGPLSVLGGPKTLWYLIKMIVRGIWLCRINCPWFAPVNITIREFPNTVWTNYLRINAHDVSSYVAMLLGAIVLVERFLEVGLRRHVHFFRTVNEEPGPTLFARVVCLLVALLVTMAFCWSCGYNEFVGGFLAFWGKFWPRVVGGNWEIQGNGSLPITV